MLKMDTYFPTVFSVVIMALLEGRVYGQACNSTVSSTIGVIQSPGYPFSYPDELDCFWRIEASPNMIIELNIETFDLENSVSCTDDSLTVFDGFESVSTVMLLQPSCGSSIPWPAHPTTLLSSGNIMTIVFSTDGFINSTGFRATYMQVVPREDIIFAADAQGSKIYKQNRFGENFEDLPYLVLVTPTAIDYDPVDSKLYITDVGISRIFRANLDGTAQETIASVLVSVPDGLAVDPVSRIVYWTDVGTDTYPTLSVARLDGSFRRILVDSDIEKPRDIVVHLNEGYVYWTDWGAFAKIERMNGDGTDRTVLVNTGLGWPNGIAIDTTGAKLYWADAFFNKIEKSNLDGSLRELIKQFHDDVHPFGLIYHDNALFWTDWASEGIDVADSEIQTEPSTLHVGGVPTRFHGLAFHSTADSAIAVNDCSFQGQAGGCDEVCTVVPSGTSCLAVSPIFANCPNDMFITTRVVTPVSWTEPTVYSPSGVPVTVTSSHPSSSLNVSPNDGTIHVTYSAIDEFGNSAKDCLFNISVTYPDEVPPTVSGCPSNISREVLSQNDVVTVNWEEPKVIDDSGEVTLTFQSHDLNGGVFPVGSTSVTYSWEDSSGNSAACSFVVMVSGLDEVPPVISGCPPNIQRKVSLQDDAVIMTWEEPKAVDDSGTVAVTFQSHGLNGGVFPAGNTTVTYIWEDSSGNSAKCSFVVAVSKNRTDGVSARFILGILSASLLCLSLPLGIAAFICYCKTGLCKNPNEHHDNHRPPPYTPRRLSQGDENRQHELSIMSQSTSPAQVSSLSPHRESTLSNSQYQEINDTHLYSRTIPFPNEQSKCPPSLPPKRCNK